ncbi:MAG: hypothetical protein V1697_02570 [Candidatus Levyibacteriota bacterium]
MSIEKERANIRIISSKPGYAPICYFCPSHDKVMKTLGLQACRDWFSKPEIYEDEYGNQHCNVKEGK